MTDVEGAPVEPDGGPAPVRPGAVRWIAAGAVVIAMVTGAALLSRGGDSPSTRLGSEPGAVAPDFSLVDLRDAGRRVSLREARGTPVVLNFFAAWCTPCREELPLLREAHARLGGKVEFLGIDHLDDREKAVALLDRFGVTYPAGFDPDGQVARRLHLRGLPSTVFIDSDGRIVGIAAGQLTQASLDGFLAKLQGAAR